MVLAGVGMARCTRPEPPVPLVTPRPEVQASATSTAMASQSVRITIRRPQTKAPSGSQQATSQEPAGATFRGGLVRLDPPESADDEVITVEIAQTVTAAASSAASVEILEDPETRLTNPRGFQGDHGRLGAILITAPGVLALDYQLARVDVPPWVAGMPLELGLDVAANTAMLGGGVSVGGKGFATSGLWVGFQGGMGWYLGLGARF